MREKHAMQPTNYSCLHGMHVSVDLWKIPRAVDTQGLRPLGLLYPGSTVSSRWCLNPFND